MRTMNYEPSWQKKRKKQRFLSPLSDPGVTNDKCAAGFVADPHISIMNVRPYYSMLPANL